MRFILPLADEIKHNLEIFNKLLSTEYECYCVYIFCNTLKYLANLLVSLRNMQIKRVFNYLSEIESLLTNEEMDLARLSILLSRKSNRLKDNYKLVDLKKAKSILEKLYNDVQKFI